jgi:nicotinamidase-related amidase
MVLSITRGSITVPAKNRDLHGSAPDTSAVVLLLIDVINDLEFDGGDALLRQALPMADRLAALKRRARACGIPAVYVNDNFGRWRSDLRAQIAHCLGDGVRGRPLVERLLPESDDYFVLKPKHSGFFATTLQTLLAYLGARTLILTGLTADNCVLFTASDAYLRDFHLVVPGDCVAAIEPRHTAQALDHMRRVLKADVTPSTSLSVQRAA